MRASPAACLAPLLRTAQDQVGRPGPGRVSRAQGPQRVDPRQQGGALGPFLGNAGQPERRLPPAQQLVRLNAANAGRDRGRRHRQRCLQQRRHPGRAPGAADAGRHRAERAASARVTTSRLRALAEHLQQRGELGEVLGGGRGPMALDELHVRGIDAGPLVGRADDRRLIVPAGRPDGVTPAGDLRVHRKAGGPRVIGAHEGDHPASLTRDDPGGAGVIDADIPLAPAACRGSRARAPGQHQVPVTARQRLAGGGHGTQRAALIWRPFDLRQAKVIPRPVPDARHRVAEPLAVQRRGPGDHQARPRPARRGLARPSGVQASVAERLGRGPRRQPVPGRHPGSLRPAGVRGKVQVHGGMKPEYPLARQRQVMKFQRVAGARKHESDANDRDRCNGSDHLRCSPKMAK